MGGLQYAAIAGVSVLAFVLLIGLFSGLPFVFATRSAIERRKDEVDLFWGLVKLVFWEPRQAVIFLRNKRITVVDESGEGGRKYIYPIRGEERRGPVPLAIRLLTWEDDILTREALPIHVKVVLWWRVSNVVKYVFDIDREVHQDETHQSLGLVESSEAWLKAITEACLRVLVSQAGVAQLVSSAATGYLQLQEVAAQQAPAQPDIVSTIAADIASRLHKDLEQKVVGYGIGIDRVEIQEISLSSDVQQAINNVWLAFLKPVQSEQEAKARQIELEATAKVLGTDAVALNEVLKNFQGSNFQMPPFLMPSFMQTLFSQIDERSKQLSSDGPSSAGKLPSGEEAPPPHLRSGTDDER